MKRIIITVAAALLAVMLVVVPVGCSEAEVAGQQNTPVQQVENTDAPFPFCRDDLRGILDSYSNVGEYIEVISPIETSWEYIEADGSTHITMISGEGWVEVVALLPEDEVNGTTVPSPIVVDVTALSNAVLASPCAVRELQWDCADMAEVFPYPRGIGIGADLSEVLAAYPNKLGEAQYGVLYSGSDFSGRIDPLDGYSGAVSYAFHDETGSCTLSYTVDEGVVCINLLSE